MDEGFKFPREERIRLTPEGYHEICKLVDKRASPEGYIRCEWCGKSVGRMHHHHIRFRSAGGSDTLENLILLCENCHSIYAHGTTGMKEQKYRMLFRDCRMDDKDGYIYKWNKGHKEEAEKIYHKYRRG